MFRPALLLTVAMLVVSLTVGGGPRPDIVVADFEGDDYGDWKATGTAFGTGPARGTLPGQMPVTGFLGKGLVNSFHGGDDSHRHADLAARSRSSGKYLNFLDRRRRATRARPASTCWSAARSSAPRPARTTSPAAASSSTGTPGTSREFAGKTAVIEIVDERDRRLGPHQRRPHRPERPQDGRPSRPARELAVDAALPAPAGQDRRAEAADEARRRRRRPSASSTSSWPTASRSSGRSPTVAPFKGKTLRVEVDACRPDSKALDAIDAGRRRPGRRQALPREACGRSSTSPSRRGWLNDPNGLVYHERRIPPVLPAQPVRLGLGQHALGPRRQPGPGPLEGAAAIALYPQKFGDWCFSGSAVVDEDEHVAASGTGDEAAAGRWPTRAPAAASASPTATTAAGPGPSTTGNPVVKHHGPRPEAALARADASTG